MLEIANDLEPRRLAKSLYFQGWRVTSIAKHLGEKRTTVHSWKTRDKWDDAPVVERVETALEARMVQLIAKDKKEGSRRWRAFAATMPAAPSPT
jgi:uncharacterized protein YjcR